MSDSTLNIQGHVFAPDSSRKISAELCFRYGEPSLRSEDGDIIVQGQPISRDKAPGGIEILTFEGGFRFETAETEKVTSLLGAPKDNLLHRLEAWHPRLFLVLCAALIGVWAIWKWGVGILVAIAIFFTPPIVVELIDDGNLSAMDRLIADPSELSEEKQAEIQAIFDRIVLAAPEPPYGSYELHFRKAKFIGPNAFALPGGTVVITDLMVKTYGDPDLIAGVLGHELAHVQEKHGLEQLYRSLSIYVLVALIAGEVGPILEDILLEGGVLASLSYSREHEREADRIGIEIARKAGYNPAALADFFEDISKEEGPIPDWLSTHPNSQERVENIRRQAEEALN